MCRLSLILLCAFVAAISAIPSSSGGNGTTSGSGGNGTTSGSGGTTLGSGGNGTTSGSGGNKTITKRSDIRLCYDNITRLSKTENGCKGKEDLENMINNSTYSGNKTKNELYVKVLLYSLGHPNFKEFQKQPQCVNMNLLYVCVVNNTDFNISSNLDSFIQFKSRLFNPDYARKNTTPAKDKATMLFTCIRVNNITSNCSNETQAFFKDIIEYIKNETKTIPIPTTPDGAAGLSPTSLSAILVISALCFIKYI